MQKIAHISAKVDTGSQSNILPLNVYNNLRVPTKLTPYPYILLAYGNKTIVTYGTTTISCVYNNIEFNINFTIVKSPGPPILGLPTCRRLNLIKMLCSTNTNTPTSPLHHTISKLPANYDIGVLVERYPHRFQGIGNFPGKLQISLNNEVRPVIHATRRVPINLHDEVSTELQRMTSIGIITPVKRPTPWVSSITYARKKSGDIRICLDPKDLNKAIRRPHYTTRTLDDVNIFSKLDARSGYWSVILSEESSYLTTFNMIKGRYRFLRMPFGLNIAQDVFQQHMDTMMQGMNGIINIADDIIIYGSTQQEHDTNLTTLMEKATSYGLVFNKDKCCISKKSISFFGQIYDKHGIHPDPERLEALYKIPAPKKCHRSTQLPRSNNIPSPLHP